MIRKIKGTAVALWQDERGASLLEYSILIGLITAGVVALVGGVGTWIHTRWVNLTANLGTP
jgi:pilus assembly protein Flp/PilA